MADIVIDEFMDDAIAAELAEDYDVLYDPTLVERPDDLKAAIKDCRARRRLCRSGVQRPGAVERPLAQIPSGSIRSATTYLRKKNKIEHFFRF